VKISREAALAARAKALAMIAGTYQAPPPKKATRTTRFMPPVSARPRDLAVRSKSGNRIGPR
jgi:hypothetical protein